MIKSRNLTFHTYNQNIADEIVLKIQTYYLKAFEDFKETLKIKAAQVD